MYARKLIFNFKDESGALGYLKGREVALDDDAIWFYDDFFTRDIPSAAMPKPKPYQKGKGSAVSAKAATGAAMAHQRTKTKTKPSTPAKGGKPRHGNGRNKGDRK